jgi:hypothetical protein
MSVMPAQIGKMPHGLSNQELMPWSSALDDKA